MKIGWNYYKNIFKATPREKLFFWSITSPNVVNVSYSTYSVLYRLVGWLGFRSKG